MAIGVFQLSSMGTTVVHDGENLTNIFASNVPTEVSPPLLEHRGVWPSYFLVIIVKLGFLILKTSGIL